MKLFAFTVPSSRLSLGSLGFIVSFFLFQSASFAAAPSKPVAVTVYPDRAAITRLAQIDVVAGEQVVELSDLPLSLNEASLQADGSGTSSVTIMELTSRIEHREQNVNQRVLDLEKGKKEIDDQLNVLAEQNRLLEAEAASLKNVETAMTHPGGAETPRPSFKELSEMLPFLSGERKRISEKTAALEKQREPLRDKLRVIEEQLAELRGTGAKAFRTVSIRLQAAAPGKFDLKVSYQVPQASWFPSYDARLRSASRVLELSYFGSVRNGTGEDWSSVALTLSTAQPSLGGGAPEPRPWIVDVLRPAPAPVAMREAQDAAQIEAFAVSSEANFKRARETKAVAFGAVAPINARQNVVSRVDSALTSASFKIDAAITIPSDNNAKKVAIAQAKLPTSLLYKTTPKLREAAFLGAKATNSTDFPLLPGPVNVFLEDAFVAASHIKSVMSGEKFDLALGVDEGIAVKRRLVNRFAEDTGLTSKGRRVTYDILTSVTNNKKSAELVEVKEPIPVSRDEKIEVHMITPSERDLGSPESNKEITRDLEGRITWRINLKPGEKREIPLKFSVEHPANIQVTGLE